MLFQFISHPLFAAGFDWLEAVLPLLFVLIWIISQIVAVFRRVRGGVRGNVEDDDNEDELISNVLLEQRMSGRQCKGCGATFVAPSLAIVDCPECGRLTPPEIDERDGTAQEEVVNPVEAEINAFLGQHMGRDQASPIAGGDGVENPIALPISNEIRRARVSASNVRLNQEARMQASHQFQSSPPEEGDITRHIHEVFDHDLGRLPQGVVESPWADLQDTTQKMTDKTRQEIANISDFGVAAMLKDPRTRRQLFVLKEILDRPKNL
ncbi:MAG: hypothetical protein HOK57_02815 [Planctomycetaceae bacterium]|nr:hypothetical protein [Planctomycetaceae bacterium]